MAIHSYNINSSEINFLMTVLPLLTLFVEFRVFSFAKCHEHGMPTEDAHWSLNLATSVLRRNYVLLTFSAQISRMYYAKARG